MYEYKIAEARRAKGWSQAELAKRLGTTQQQVARYESGENDVKSSMVVKMSKTLGVTISYLLNVAGDDEEPRDTRFDELAGIYRSMSETGRDALLAAARGLRAAYPGDGRAREGSVGRSA